MQTTGISCRSTEACLTEINPDFEEAWFSKDELESFLRDVIRTGSAGVGGSFDKMGPAILQLAVNRGDGVRVMLVVLPFRHGGELLLAMKRFELRTKEDHDVMADWIREVHARSQ